MSCYVPSCVPTCIPPSGSPICYPVGGLGSVSSGGGLISSGGGGGVPAASLGIAPGATVSCLNQTPPSEVYIQPAPFTVVIPGPVLAASCEPARVGGYTACASGSPGSLGRASRSPLYGCRPYICRS